MSLGTSYADDLVLIAETFDFLMEKLKLRKDDIKNEGLHVNMGKTKLMICVEDLDTKSGLSMNGMGSHLHAPTHASIYMGMLLLLMQNFI